MRAEVFQTDACSLSPPPTALQILSLCPPASLLHSLCALLPRTALQILCLFALAISRACNIYPLCFIVNYLRPPQRRISQRMQFMMWWSGLRGGKGCEVGGLRGRRGHNLSLISSMGLGISPSCGQPGDTQAGANTWQLRADRCCNVCLCPALPLQARWRLPWRWMHRRSTASMAW